MRLKHLSTLENLSLAAYDGDRQDSSYVGRCELANSQAAPPSSFARYKYLSGSRLLAAANNPRFVPVNLKRPLRRSGESLRHGFGND